MPPVFAQPTPISRYSSGSMGGGGASYASLANSYMDFSSQAADRYSRTMLGAQQLRDQMTMNREDLQGRENQLTAHMVMRAAAAQDELDQWAIKQRFTAQDQQDLSRQQNAVSELQDRYDKGEITQNELYQMLGKVAPRVNYLQFKEQHTRNQALNEQRQAMAAAQKSQLDFRDNAIAFQQAELDGKLDYHIPPRFASKVSRIMAEAHPELKPGTSEYAEMSKAVADEEGWAVRYTKKADGTVVYEHDVRGAGGEKGGRGAQGGDGSSQAMQAMKDAQAWAKQQDVPPTQDQINAYAENLLGFAKKHSAEGKQQSAAETSKTIAGVLQVRADEVKSLPGASAAEKANLGNIVTKQKQLMEEFPLGNRPARIQKKLDEYERQYKAALSIIAARPKPGVPAGDQQAPAPGAPGAPAGEQPLVFDRPTDVTVTPAVAVGNAARNFRDILYSSAPSNMGAKTKNALTDIWRFMGIPDHSRE